MTFFFFDVYQNGVVRASVEVECVGVEGFCFPREFRCWLESAFCHRFYFAVVSGQDEKKLVGFAQRFRAQNDSSAFDIFSLFHYSSVLMGFLR